MRTTNRYTQGAQSHTASEVRMRRVILCLLALVSVGCGPSGFVADDFELSDGFETSEFRVRPITVADAEKDYEAVMESIEVIHSSFLDDSWPTESFTLDQNRRDLGAKERKFQRRQSFTYTVVSPDESQVLGCVYINKGINGPDAAVFMWVRPSANATGLDSRLEAAVRDWMKTDWPFEWVVFPGRGAPQSGVGKPEKRTSPTAKGAQPSSSRVACPYDAYPHEAGRWCPSAPFPPSLAIPSESLGGASAATAYSRGRLPMLSD